MTRQIYKVLKYTLFLLIIRWCMVVARAVPHSSDEKRGSRVNKRFYSKRLFTSTLGRPALANRLTNSPGFWHRDRDETITSIMFIPHRRQAISTWLHIDDRRNDSLRRWSDATNSRCAECQSGWGIIDALMVWSQLGVWQRSAILLVLFINLHARKSA
jgi:hypothetical protein